MPYTISNVEDDAKYASLSKKLLDSHSDLACVSIYPNGNALLSSFAEQPTDLILMDIQLRWSGTYSQYKNTLIPTRS